MQRIGYSELKHRAGDSDLTIAGSYGHYKAGGKKKKKKPGLGNISSTQK